jgi:Leucine-rich repeat (LRR) protein
VFSTQSGYCASSSYKFPNAYACLNEAIEGLIPNLDMPNLQYLGLNENAFTWVPSGFNLPSLIFLAVSDNRLSGSP